jgi:hypothetical protein
MSVTSEDGSPARALSVEEEAAIKDLPPDDQELVRWTPGKLFVAFDRKSVRAFEM